VYVYDDSGVYAVDAATGELEWEQTVAGYAGAGPTVAGGRVYLGTDEGRVAAFDAADGTEQWTVERREPFDSPAVVDGTVYVVGDRVYALDAESGDVVWAQAVAGDPEGAIPAVGDGSLYTRGGEGRIVALETSDGSERWEFTREGRTFRTPAVVDGRVYVGEAGQEQAEVSLRVLDAGTGELDWAFATREFASAPAVGDGSAYIATGTDEVVGLDAAGGAEQWRFGDGERVIGPSLFGNTVYVSTGGSRLRGLASGDGSEQLSVRVGEETSVGTPVVRNGRLYARVGNAIRAYGSA
jgi:outer membrane protein assembly factor BamB